VAFSAARAIVAKVPARNATFFKRVAKAQLPIYFVILLRWNATMAYANCEASWRALAAPALSRQ
jgi:hypothetical protein